MTQVNLERHPYARHIFYEGVYTHNSIGYRFELTVEESISVTRPTFIIEFNLDHKLLPFDFDKASKEILAVYLPENGNQETKD